MFQEHPNNLMVLYVYKERLDHLDLTSNGQDFVNGREGRVSLFVLSTSYRIYVFYTNKL